MPPTIFEMNGAVKASCIHSHRKFFCAMNDDKGIRSGDRSFNFPFIELREEKVMEKARTINLASSGTWKRFTNAVVNEKSNLLCYLA